MYVVVKLWDIVKSGQWNRFCELVGIDKGIDTPIDKDTPVYLTEWEAKELGLKGENKQCLKR
jgi:hypothetical protein